MRLPSGYAPRARLLAMLVLPTRLPLSALASLGARVHEQDGALPSQRRLERLQNSANELADSLTASTTDTARHANDLSAGSSPAGWISRWQPDRTFRRPKWRATDRHILVLRGRHAGPAREISDRHHAMDVGRTLRGEPGLSFDFAAAASCHSTYDRINAPIPLEIP
jgi:hypothetical protein